MNPTRFLKAPIPGENLTQDTRGYAWHRPPQFPDFDDALEYFIDTVLGDKERLLAGITLIGSGVSAMSALNTVLLNMVGAGKITPDMSLMIAGPAYKIFTNALDAMGIEYLTGFDTPDEMKALLSKDPSERTKESTPLTAEQEAQFEKMQEELEDVRMPVGGLMGAPAEDEQPIDIPREQTGRALVEVPAEDQEDKA
jgi:hypothetical protein